MLLWGGRCLQALPVAGGRGAAGQRRLFSRVTLSHFTPILPRRLLLRRRISPGAPGPRPPPPTPMKRRGGFVPASPCCVPPPGCPGFHPGSEDLLLAGSSHPQPGATSAAASWANPWGSPPPPRPLRFLRASFKFFSFFLCLL